MIKEMYCLRGRFSENIYTIEWHVRKCHKYVICHMYIIKCKLFLFDLWCRYAYYQASN